MEQIKKFLHGKGFALLLTASLLAAAATRQASSASVKPLLRKNFLICSIVVTPICCIVYALLLGLVWDSRAGFMHSFI